MRSHVGQKAGSSWFGGGSAVTVHRSTSARPAWSRAAVRLASGEVGFGYVLGRDGEKARLIALCDALLQSGDLTDELEQKVIAPLRQEREAARGQQAAATAATRVDFYTLVRGEG